MSLPWLLLVLGLVARPVPAIAQTTLVSTGAVWRYLDNGSDQGTAWRQLGFDDRSWPSGPAQLGYGDGDEQTVVGFGPDPNNRFVTTYFRQAFDVADPIAYVGLTLRVLRDDGVVVYLNGSEVFRSNLPGGEIASSTFALQAVAGSDEQVFHNRSVPVGFLRSGTNLLAAEIHQANPTSTDISFDLELAAWPRLTNIVSAPLIPLGAIWTYRDDGSNLGSSWRLRTFDDSTWASGPARLGYGGDGEMTTVSFGPNPNAKFVTTYFRHRFYVDDPEVFNLLTIRVTRDDGVVVHLNGPEVFRDNMPSGTPTYTTTALSAVSGSEERILFETNLPPALLLAGTNVLTAEVHQSSGSSSDLGFDLELLGETVFPPRPVPLSAALIRNDAVQLTWTAPAVGYQLQAVPALSANPAWTNVLDLPTVQAGRRALTLAADPVTRFFTLTADEVDSSTLTGKLVFGYQGWFLCRGDSAPPNGWVHWFRRSTPVATNATVDFWPDIAELEADELFDTDMTLPGGQPARLYSSYKPRTVLRHFRWMRDHGIDGVMLQRFSSELSSASFFAVRNQLARNVRAGAEAYGRVFNIMYDISGNPEASLVSDLTNDWTFLSSSLRLTNSARYLRHNGRPVVAVWGLGFTDRPGTPQQAQAVIDFFKNAGLTVMGGVPTNWRTLSGDSKTDPAWATVYRSFDIISPWSVGRYSSDSGADNFRTTRIEPDLAETRTAGRDYLPVIWPGFSWFNLNGGAVNQIPRRGGRFWWRQFYNAVSAGCTMVYGAMFDEVDEGTAMFKLAPTASELPVEGTFVPLNMDGEALPSDWYLRVAGQASRVLRGDQPLTANLPISP